MFFPTATGQSIDVSSDFGANINAGALLGSRITQDNLTAAPTPSTLHESATSIVAGDWFGVPDNQIVGKNHALLGIEISIEWHLPDGSIVMLADDEWRGDSDLLNVFRSDNFTYHNNSVKLTANTRAGLEAAGAIPPGTQPRNPPAGSPASKPVSTQQAVVASANALLIIALIGAAIYFLPKGILRGGA